MKFSERAQHPPGTFPSYFPTFRKNEHQAIGKRDTRVWLLTRLSRDDRCVIMSTPTRRATSAKLLLPRHAACPLMELVLTASAAMFHPVSALKMYTSLTDVRSQDFGHSWCSVYLHAHSPNWLNGVLRGAS